MVSMAPVGISVGEVLLWTAFAGFCIFWFVYWRVIFTYTTDVKLASETEHVSEEVAARLMGHMTNLFSALLLFPVSRTGLWVDVFGVPYDRCIKYHRMLGAAVYLFVTLHAWIWWNKWAEELLPSTTCTFRASALPSTTAASSCRSSRGC